MRRRLDNGADPDALDIHGCPLLHQLARWGSPESVFELADRVAEVDRDYFGRTALWVAVFHRRTDNARALERAGADPWRPMMAGWAPWRLNLAGPEPAMFSGPPGAPGLSPDEETALTESHRLIAALGPRPHDDGQGLACVAGIDTVEVGRRLQATRIEEAEPGSMMAQMWGNSSEEGLRIVGATDVPGGCVVSQPWGFIPTRSVVMKALSLGTVGYGFYANPKSGNQGAIARDGVIVGHDLHPGGGEPAPDESGLEIFLHHLYQGNPAAYSCAYAGLRPPDVPAIRGTTPDVWLEVPERDSWY